MVEPSVFGVQTFPAIISEALAEINKVLAKNCHN